MKQNCKKKTLIFNKIINDYQFVMKDVTNKIIEMQNHIFDCCRNLTLCEMSTMNINKNA